MIELRIGELAEAETDAVLRPVAADWSAVTPATRRLELAAGPAVESQCARLGELPVGSAAITPAGELAARFLVHAVIRSYEEPVTHAVVARALQNGLRRLEEWGIASVSMPPLGTGAGNLDADDSADVMVPILSEALGTSKYLRRIVIFVENDYERDTFEAAQRRAEAAE